MPKRGGKMKSKMNLLVRNAFLSLFLMLIMFTERGVCHNKYDCKESRCSPHGPAIRFPFRIKDRPDHCGVAGAGFDLSCTEKKQTLLQLPNSAELIVEKIDYVSQVIRASDPDRCLPRQLSNLNLSASPFRFHSEYELSITLLNCSRRKKSPYIQAFCPIAPGYQVHTYFPETSIANIDLINCTKMYDVSVPDDFVWSNNRVLTLNWSNPSCGFCAKQGKYCRFNANSSQPDCDGNLRPTKWSCAKFLAPGIILAILILAALLIAVYRIHSYNKTGTEYQSRIENFLNDYRAFKPARYSYADIKRIANNFKDKLGQGAYGTVFKGKLSDDILVAVKLLNDSKGNGEEFVNEVGAIGRIHHVNVVRLIGYCVDGFRRALVYEYLPNDSLEKFITSPDARNHFLGWKRLQDIAIGSANGIEYLHQGCNQRILHFDIKPRNILLDNDFNPKISDFGLAKLCAKDQSAVSMTTARGTVGYIAPEVFSRNFGNVSYKSDVYSFGMLVLEMVGGRKTVNGGNEKNDEIYFPEWIYNLVEGGQDLRVEMEEEEDAKIAKKLATVGLWCIQWNPVYRPSMRAVIEMLEGEGDNLPIPANPFSSSTNSTRNNARLAKHFDKELEAISEIE